MKYSVLEKIKLKTSKGGLELLPGQVITLQDNIAIRLINEGRIIPVGEVTYKIYSRILKDYLWVAATEEELQELMADGIKEVIYTHKEVSRLMGEGVSKEGLRKIHNVKKVFPGATIENIESEQKKIQLD